MRRGILGLVCLSALVAGLTGTAQAAKYDDDTVIVKFAGGVSSAQRAALFDATGVKRTVGSVAGVGAQVVTRPGRPGRGGPAAQPQRAGLLRGAQLHPQGDGVPNDPLFPELYGLNNTGQTGGSGRRRHRRPRGLGRRRARRLPRHAAAPKIGIVDTGIDQTHPELSGKAVDCAAAFGGTVSNGTCADDNMHGTHVAGTIAAKANNATGVAGVAFNSNLTICKALYTAAGTGLTSDVANCINWTHARGAKVISMSLGGGASTTLKNAVAPPGRTEAPPAPCSWQPPATTATRTLNYPAAYPEVVSVAATDQNDARAIVLERERGR